MQEFYIGQEFYYKDPQNGKRIYLKLVAYKDDVLYLKTPYGQKYAVKKYYLNKTLFISLRPQKKRKRKAPAADKVIMPAYNPSNYAGDYKKRFNTKRAGAGSIEHYERLNTPGIQKEDDWSKYDYKIKE